MTLTTTPAGFTYDVTTSRLGYSLKAQLDAAGATLHRGGTENGPVIARLLPAAASSELRLSAADRDAPEHGHLYLEVATESGSATRAQVRLR